MNELRALLLTDVVDSTQLAERLGDAAAAELNTAHDRVARDLLRVWNGREIDKTDGMLMLFDAAADALGFAMAYHTALAALPVPLRARAGLHVGAVILRTNPLEDVAHGAKPMEVEGIAKPVAARVMSLALGGQTLLTAEARVALGETPFRVQSHGFWRMKGVAEPMELFEAGDEYALFVPPPDSTKLYRVVRSGELWLPRREVPRSLPAERDAFVGRQDALAELARRFDGGARLASLLGIGGTGKTRLAIHFAWSWLGDFPGGAWFCDLSQARDADGLLHAVAQGLDVPLGAEDPVMQLGHAIAGRGACLLILDNFEQVARYGADTVGAWLDRAAEACFLVTTREVLGLPGEEALTLAPLGAADAEALFMRRAAAASSDFSPGDGDREAVPKLVKLLDGLPLAIELAAARVRVMSPATLLARMDQRFRLLVATGGRKDRQATLRAAIDWSWDLLGLAEKVALMQLSVFAGGFTLDAAESVLDLSACDGSNWVVDVLQSLVDKSLVQRVSDKRFSLLHSVQDYAHEQLRKATAVAAGHCRPLPAIERDHCAYYAVLNTRDAMADAAVELDNLVVACRRAVQLGEPQLATTLLANAWSVVERRGPFRLGLELAEAALALPCTPRDRARARLVAGRAARHGGLRDRAVAHFEAAAADAAQAGDTVVLAHAQCLLASLEAEDGRVEESLAQLSRIWESARKSGDGGLCCAVQNELGNLCFERGALESALGHYEQALATARGCGDLSWEGGLLGNLGNVQAEFGHHDDARASYMAAIGIARKLGDLPFLGNTLSNLGLLDHLAGWTDEAKRHLNEGLSIARDIGHRRLESVVDCNLGMHFDGQGDTASALTHFDRALAVSRELQDQRATGQAMGHLGLLHLRRGDIETARRCLAEGEALLRDGSDPGSLALLLCARAQAEHRAGAGAAAARCVEESDSLAAALGAKPGSELGLALARTRSFLAAGVVNGD